MHAPPPSCLQVPTFHITQLANLLVGLGQLEIRPSPVWLNAVSNHVRVNLMKGSGSSLASAMWGLSMMGYVPSRVRGRGGYHLCV